MIMANKVPIVQATFYNNNTKQIENCYPMTSAKGVVMSDGKTLEESFSDKADNSVVVHKSGDEEILGRKTFDDLRANGFSLSNYGDWNRWVSAFYSFLENQGIIQFGTEEDWSVILRNIADPENENDAATKGYVDIKIGDASIPLLQYGALINNNIPSVFEREEHAIANAPIYAKILSGEVQFFAAKIGGVGLFVSRSISSNKSSFELIGLDFKNLAEILITISIDQSGLTQAVTLSKNLQSVLTDTDGSYGQRVAEVETGKANLQHHHTVADITDFPEQYYDATAFFTSGAYPSDKYEELLEAVKAKKTVYATIDEEGYVSHVFFMSTANSDGSSSRVLLTTIFADGSTLYTNTFVLQQSGMTSLQENITGKANKATTLAGYGIGDAYTKSELDALLKGKQDTLTAGNGISIEGGVISSTVDSLITPTTYAELVALRNSSSLIAGMQYRITDYDFTTTEEDTDSAHQLFDIIVTADSESVLNESARAMHHQYAEGEADSLSSRDIAAWELKYTLKNTKHSSRNGKGTVLWMKDEFRNECNYDFINARYKVYEITACAKSPSLVGTYAIKAKNSAITYGTINKLVSTFGSDSHDNVIKYDGLAKIVLGNSCSSNTFGNNCLYNTFGKKCSQNTFGNSCRSNIFGDYCSSNIFGNDCLSNTFGNSCSHNTFGNSCRSNTVGKNCSYNTFGNSCRSNIFGDYCSSNTFGNNCETIEFASTSDAITKYNYYKQNHFGDGCKYIVFKGAETASSSAQVQNYNFAQGVQGTSSAYLTIDGVRSRAYETKVAKNSSGELKIYCEADLIQ